MESKKFKAGDRVVCLEPCTGLTLGGVYTVKEGRLDGLIGITTDDGLNVDLFASRFKLAEPDKTGPEKSDGGSTGYYDLPEHATELRHLISAKGMSKSRGDIFKACYRLGNKDGASIEYDLNKMKFFIEDLIEMHQRGEHI